MDNTTTVQYAGLISQLSDKARSVVRDLDPSNDLTFLRIRSKKHEIMVAPGKLFGLKIHICLQLGFISQMLFIHYLIFIEDIYENEKTINIMGVRARKEMF